VERIRNFVLDLPDRADGDEDEFVTGRREALLDALADDFNTPRALAALFELIAEGNRRQLAGARAALEEMLPLLGLESLLRPVDEIDPEAERLMEAREQARAGRDFRRADRIRDELASRGYQVRDTPEGPRLVRRSG
jgi:cysteinyl-tRNA synthetase